MSNLEPDIHNQKCQIHSVVKISEPASENETSRLSIKMHLKLALKKTLSPRFKRTLKTRLNDFMIWWRKMTGSTEINENPALSSSSQALRAGDMVHICSKEEIQSTLNYFNELKGCGYFPEMWQYCGTTQRVLKPVERFVDERDYQVKKARGVVLLEGVICQGTELYGRCDRACFYFWREEWLEKID